MGGRSPVPVRGCGKPPFEATKSSHVVGRAGSENHLAILAVLGIAGKNTNDRYYFRIVFSWAIFDTYRGVPKVKKGVPWGQLGGPGYHS